MKKNLIPILIIILVIIMIGAFFVLNPEAGRGILVEIGLAEPPLDAYPASGLIEGDTSIINSLTGGSVKMIFVTEGQQIDENDKLLTFDTDLIELQIKVKEAELSVLEAELAHLKSIPLEIDTNILDRSIDFAQISLDTAEAELENYEDTKIKTLDEINKALLQAKIDSSKADLSNAEAQKQSLLNVVSEDDLKLIETGISAKEQEIDALEEILSKHTLYAPRTGVISQISVNEGENSLPGAVLLKITSNANMKLTVYIPEADLNWVKVGQEITFQIDGQSGVFFPGKVISISDEAEFTPRNVQTPEERTVLVYEVVIQVLSTDDRLKSGIPADVTFEVEK